MAHVMKFLRQAIWASQSGAITRRLSLWIFAIFIITNLMLLRFKNKFSVVDGIFFVFS